MRVRAIKWRHARDKLEQRDGNFHTLIDTLELQIRCAVKDLDPTKNLIKTYAANHHKGFEHAVIAPQSHKLAFRPEAINYEDILQQRSIACELRNEKANNWRPMMRIFKN